MTASMHHGGNQLQKFVQRDTNHREISPDIVHMNFARALGPKPVQVGPKPFDSVSSSTSSALYTYGGIVAGAEEATATTATYKSPTVSGRPSIHKVLEEQNQKAGGKRPVLPSPASQDFERLSEPYHYHPRIDRAVGEISLVNLMPGTKFGELLCNLYGHSYSVTDLAINYDGTRCVSGSADGSVRQWDLQRGREIGTTGKGHKGIVKVSLSRNEAELERTCFSGDDSGKLKLWDIGGGDDARLSWTIHSKEAGVSSVAMTQRYGLAASDNQCFVYDFRNIKEPLKIHRHTSRVRSLTVTAESSASLDANTSQSQSDRCVSCSDRNVEIWSLTDLNSPVVTIPYGGSSVDVTVDGKAVITSTRSVRQNVRVWDVGQGKLCASISAEDCGDKEAVATRCISIAREGLNALSASVDCRVHYWHLGSGKRESLFGVVGKCKRVALSLDGFIGLVA